MGDWLSLRAEPVSWRRYPNHGPNPERRRYLTRLGGECEIVLRTCFVCRWIYEANRRPRLAALPENRPRRNQVAPVCFPRKMLAHFSSGLPYGLASLAESSRLPAALYGPLHVPVGLALRDVAALVPTLLAPGERELDLRPPVLEVELRRDERQALLGDLSR